MSNGERYAKHLNGLIFKKINYKKCIFMKFHAFICNTDNETHLSVNILKLQDGDVKTGRWERLETTSSSSGAAAPTEAFVLFFSFSLSGSSNTL